MSALLKDLRQVEAPSFSVQSKRLIDWCKYDALPLWGKYGVDKAGGFYETLNYDGSPDLTVKRRVRVQARQCYVYSLAITHEWFPPSRGVSDHGWAYLSRQGLQGGDHIPSDGFKGCAHLLNPDGSLNDDTRDTYAQAFLLLSSAWRYRATSDPLALQILYATTSFLNIHFRSETGGWIEDCRYSMPRRQNPHMHLFEAFMASFEATHNEKFLDLADEIFALFKGDFFNLRNQCLIEYFNNDWTPKDLSRARVEPGHMMEWCWLLEWYGRLRDRQVKQYVDALYNSAIKNGLNKETGFLTNEYRLDGTISNGSSRLWPQTEFIKACIARYKLGHTDALAQAATIIENLFKYFLHTPLCGGWHDSLDGEGNVNSSQMPASTFYHLACAVNELEKLN